MEMFKNDEVPLNTLFVKHVLVSRGNQRGFLGTIHAVKIFSKIKYLRSAIPECELVRLISEVTVNENGNRRFYRILVINERKMVETRR